MAQLHRPRFIEPGARTRLDVRALLDAREWTSRAACAGQDQLFLAEGPTHTKAPALASGVELLKFLHCARCPVRLPCLLEGLNPPTIPVLLVINEKADTENVALGQHQRSAEHVPHVYGVWGGSNEYDRYQVRDLDLTSQARELERTFPERLDARTQAWRSMVAARRMRSWRDRLVAEFLGEELPPRPPKSAPVAKFPIQRRRVTAAPSRPALSVCAACGSRMAWNRRSDASYCSTRCRVSAWRRMKAAGGNLRDGPKEGDPAPARDAQVSAMA